MGTVETRKYTYEDLRTMPQNGNRYELIGGEVYVTPSPNTKHQRVAGNLYFEIRQFVKGRGLGEVFFAPFDVVFGDQDVVQPDLLFISRARSAIVTPSFIHGAPDLVIEVLSPTTAGYDVEIKRQLYASSGVSEIWFADPRSDSIEVLRLEEDGSYGVAGRFAGDQVLVSQTLPGLELPLSRIFA